LEYSWGPSEQKAVKKWPQKKRGRIQGLPKFLGTPIISGMGKATDFSFS